jgi:hypothetical protein
MNKPWIGVVLMSIYPILVLFDININEASFQSVIFPITTSFFGSLFIYWLMLRLVRNKYKASLVTILFILFFYFYGHVFYQSVSGIHLGEITVGRHRFFYPLWILLFISSAFLIAKLKTRHKELSVFLNYLSIFLVLTVITSILSTLLFDEIRYDSASVKSNNIIKNRSLNNDMPNIYYIVPDGYASFDTLKNVYGFDNSDFKSSLESHGFYVADNSTTNHSFTYLSLSSSLNMMYMDWLSEKSSNKNKTKLKTLGSYIENNKVARLLKSEGYKYITFDSGYSTTSATTSSIADLNVPCAPVSEFERILLRTTMLDPFFLYGGVRDTILCQFETLGNVAKSNSNFIFAHIVAPHPPFVFDSNGGKVGMNSGLNPWSEKKLFVEQTKFINKKILELIVNIKNNSEIKPMIIIQSDHGPASLGTEEMLNPSNALIKERMGILNAYYVPENIRKNLYKEITPVNSFRVILSDLLKVNLPILEDINWFTPIGQDALVFNNVSDAVKYE